MPRPYTADGLARIGSDRTYSFNAARVILLSVLMSLLVAATLYLHHTVLDQYHTYLLGEEKKTTAWIELQLSYMLPFITVALFQYFVYHADDRQDGILRREMAWEILLVALLTYAVLMPYVIHMSRTLHEAAIEAGEEIKQTAAGVDSTLWMEVHDWFIRFSVPLMLLVTYHFVRADREAREAASPAPAGALPAAAPADPEPQTDVQTAPAAQAHPAAQAAPAAPGADGEGNAAPAAGQ